MYSKRIGPARAPLFAICLLLAACGAPTSEDAGSAGAESGAAAQETTTPPQPTGSLPEETGDGDTGFDEVLAAIEGLDGQERIDELVRLAQEEGVVQVYSTMNSMPKIATAFTEEYDVEVEAYDAGSSDIRNRVLEEAAANNVIADVVENNGPEMFLLNEEGMLVPYSSVHEGELIDEAEQDGWTAVRVNYFVTSWNTNLVSPEEAPTSYQDLTEPMWEGRMAMEVSDADWYWAVSGYLAEEEGLSEAEVDQLFRGMVANSSVVDGHTNARQLLIAGEYAVLASDLRHSATGDIAEGAPIAWQPPVEPMFGRANGAGLVKNAPHPAAAILMLEFLLGETAQQILADDFYNPTNAELAESDERYDARLIDIPRYMQDREDAEEAYEAIVTGRDA